MKYRYAVMIAVLAGCSSSNGGGGGGGGGNDFALTFNGTTTVAENKEATVEVRSNEPFTVEAPDAVGWTFSWGADAEYAVDYPSSLGGTIYASKIATPKATQRIVTAYFDEAKTLYARLVINVVAGGTCDETVTCSDHGPCMQNAADFPVCNCELPYRPSGFECVAPRSCILTANRCIDFTGEYWVSQSDEMGYCATQSGTYSETSCAPPSATVLTGTCLIQAYAGVLNSGTAFYYYSYDPLAARTTCETEQGGIWMPVTPG